MLKFLESDQTCPTSWYPKNINSVNSKFDQMKFLLQGKVNILVLTEIKLDNSFLTNQFLTEGYSKPLG